MTKTNFTLNVEQQV